MTGPTAARPRPARRVQRARLGALLGALAAGLGCLAGCGAAADGADDPARPAATSAPSPTATAAAGPPPSATAAIPTQAAPPPPPPVPTEEDTAPSLPEGFVRLGSDPASLEEAAPVACGVFQVENVRGDPRVWEPFVRVTGPGGRRAYEAHGRRYDVDAGVQARMSLVADVCGDLTGDGVPELVLTERTMGAHCCYTHYVVSLTAPTRTLLRWDKGDSGNGLWPAKLVPGPTWQLRSVDLVSPPFDVEAGDPSVSYSGIPGYPIVFDLVGGAYVKRTFRFADALRAERDAERARCATRPGCEPYVLYDWGMALLVGDWERTKEALVPDPEERAPLERRAAAMLARMRAQLGR